MTDVCISQSGYFKISDDMRGDVVYTLPVMKNMYKNLLTRISL
jgi:hypothetical protein